MLEVLTEAATGAVLIGGIVALAILGWKLADALSDFLVEITLRPDKRKRLFRSVLSGVEIIVICCIVGHFVWERLPLW